MRRQRVGTLSLGILLIVLGILLLTAQFKQRLILDMLLIWWPLILVLIGVEILWYVYTSTEQEPKVKYDAFSIFIIMVIVFSSIGIYALTATGVVERVSRNIKSSIVSADVPSQRFPVREEIKKIIIYAPGGKLDIKRNSNPDIIVFGRAVVDAIDNEEAKALIEENPVVFQEEGNMLFVQFPADVRSGGPNPYIREMRHTLLMPANQSVEVSGDYFYVSIDTKALGKGWLIKGNGILNITADKEGDDLSLRAQVDDPERLKGNVNWQLEESGGDGTDGRSAFEGRLKWGEGTNRVDVFIESGSITVNEL